MINFARGAMTMTHVNKTSKRNLCVDRKVQKVGSAKRAKIDEMISATRNDRLNTQTRHTFHHD